MAQQLTRYDLERYVAERQRIGKKDFLPIVNIPAQAMVLISYFGKYDLQQNEKDKTNEPIILNFAIKPLLPKDPAESYRKWLNSIRANLSQLRGEIRKKGRIPEKFSMISKGWTWHVDKEHIICSIEYRHNDKKKTMTEIERALSTTDLKDIGVG